MKIKLNIFIVFLAGCFPFFLRSQTETPAASHEIKGRIIDESTKEPLVGASVTYETGKGVTTDTDGYFSLSLPDGEYVLTISYVGYDPFSQKISVKGQAQEIKPVSLKNSNALSEVEVVADIARSRETPIAFSDVDAKQIIRELGANDITMLLNSTPGAYASQQGGGAGDSRVNIRGFDQRYIGVLVDGVPVNDMENGRVFWSNWSGLGEVSKKVQVQRGLGASRLAIPAVGGVMNIITNSIDHERSLIVRNDMGTNNYHKFSAAYNSGLIKNKFGFTLSGSYTEGDGIIDQTWQKTWSYLAKVSCKLNNKNLLILSVNGAPQSHGQRSFAINMVYHDKKFAENQGINADSIYSLPSNRYTTSNIGDRGINYSPDWGYLNGEPKAVKVNYFHKPLFNLSYFLTINSRMSYSNVLYLSLGKGGSTTLSSFPNYDKSGSGQLLIQGQYDANVATATGTLVPDSRPSTYYIQSSINNHKWAGTLSTLKYKILSSLDFLGGFDARYFIGTHYQTPVDLLGGDYVVAANGRDVNMAPFSKDPHSYVKRPGDKINYHNDSKITWLGLFGQLEYKVKRLTAFVTLTGNQSGYQYINYFGKKDIVFSKSNKIHNAVGYGDTLFHDGQNYGVLVNGNTNKANNNDGSITFFDNLTQRDVTISRNYSTYHNSSPEAKTNTSRVKYLTGYTVKGGANYQLNNNNNVFVNTGYMNLVPKFNNVFDNSGNEVLGVKNQLITSAELGYGMRYSKFAANINGYITKWGNKPADFIANYYDTTKKVTVYYNMTGIDALLKGVEFDLTYEPVKFMELKVFGMAGDWKWNSGGTTYAYSESGAVLDTIVFDAKGVPIGNAPQRQLGGSAKFEYRNFYIKVQYIYFDKMYAQFDPANLKVEGKGPQAKDYRGYSSWKMPAYGVCDLYGGYKLTSGKTVAELFASVNNVLNTIYMTDAFFPGSSIKPNMYNALNAVSWMGLGRRFNVGIRITFK